MGKKLSAVFFGTVVAIVVILFCQLYINSLYPLPAGINPDDTKTISELYLNMPTAAFLLLLAAYMLGSFSGGFVAAIISKDGKTYIAIIVGIILTAMGLVNLIRFPHPLWFWVVSLPVYVPFAYIGSKLRK